MNQPSLPEDAQGPLDWQVHRLNALSSLQLLRIMRARQQVFVVEQNCPYLDADTADEYSWHLGAWLADGRLSAYARVVDPGINYLEASIGRVITAQAVRGRGLGKELMTRALRHAALAHPGSSIRISAQNHLRVFYGSFGFQAQGEIYQEDGIPHISMYRPADPIGTLIVHADSGSAARQA